MNPENPAGLTASQYTIQGISQTWSLGIRSNFPQGRVANNYVIQETLTRIAGRHTLRFGLDLLEQRSRQFAPIPERGRYTYAASNFGGVSYTAFANFVDDFAGEPAVLWIALSAGRAIIRNCFVRRTSSRTAGAPRSH